MRAKTPFVRSQTGIRDNFAEDTFGPSRRPCVGSGPSACGGGVPYMQKRIGGHGFNELAYEFSGGPPVVVPGLLPFLQLPPRSPAGIVVNVLRLAVVWFRLLLALRRQDGFQRCSPAPVAADQFHR